MTRVFPALASKRFILVDESAASQHSGAGQKVRVEGIVSWAAAGRTVAGRGKRARREEEEIEERG